MKRVVTILILCALFASSAAFHQPRALASGAESVVIFNNWNKLRVQNRPTDVTVFIPQQDFLVQSILTYHWNNGKGSQPGTIGLVRSSDGVVIGEWPANGQSGMNGAPNVNWFAYPDVTLDKGVEYAITDSNSKTWSQNGQSEGCGFAEVKGLWLSPADKNGEQDDVNDTQQDKETTSSATLTLIGHASVKIKTSAGAVIYIDPYHPGDYSEGADLILVSHEHSDHSKVGLVSQNEGCLTLRVKQTINPDGSYNLFEHMGMMVEPFPAANRNHKRNQINGYLLTFDGLTVYYASDTSRIPEMDYLAPRGVDYALLPIDGQYNMGAKEAMECAALIGARHNIPMHFFNADPAAFQPENLLFIPYGESVALGGE